MKRSVLLFVLFIFFVGYNFGQRNVMPGKTPTSTKAGNFEHVEGVMVAVNGIQMYYEEYGEGTPLLMIHNNGGSVESFGSQINFFAKKFRVIVADSRGHGQTENTTDSLTYEIMADDYYALLEKLEIDSACVVGWNDGAIIAMMLAINYPHKVKMLAIYDARLNSDSTVFNAEIKNIYLGLRQQYKDSITAGKSEYKTSLQQMNLLLHHPGLDPELLLNVTAPTLVMCGDRDILQLQHTLLIYQNIPQAQLSVFPDADQYLLTTTPVVFNTAVSKYFTKLLKKKMNE